MPVAATEEAFAERAGVTGQGTEEPASPDKKRMTTSFGGMPWAAS